MKNLYKKTDFYLEKKDLDALTDSLSASYADGLGVNLEEGANLPRRSEIISLTAKLEELLFPGFDGEERYHQDSMHYRIGNLLVEVMRGIAGDGNNLRARFGKLFYARLHGRERRFFAFSENIIRSVGNGSLTDQNDVEMILITARFCMFRDQLIKIDAGSRSQSAEDSESFCHNTAFLRILRDRACIS